MRKAEAPSLRRRLLIVLATPLAIAWLASGALIYILALHYANENYDRSLHQGVLALKKIILDDVDGGELNRQARILLEYDSENPTYYSVRSLEHGLLAANLELPLPQPLPQADGEPALYSIEVAGRHLRMAALLLELGEPNDRVVVGVAESLGERYALAREILIGTLPVVLLLITTVLVVVWVAVTRGLRLLDPLTAQIAARPASDLSALIEDGVPVEIQPLTRTINALFRRLKQSLDLQQQFLADAAHQLRTPLAGMRLQAERALADPRPETVRAALSHVERLSAGAGRAAGQLLALARAQAIDEEQSALAPVDLARIARDQVAERSADAIARHIDLGYAGPTAGALVEGDAVMLREALVNLVDNAFAYAGEHGRITVSVSREADEQVLAVEDSGSGVDEACWPELGTRFYRPPGSRQGGSGLGLAIVRSVAERHGATLRFGHAAEGGLRVALHFATRPA